MDAIDAYKRWSAAPFPTGSPDDRVDELHGNLATWDAFVLGVVYPVPEHGAEFQEPPADVSMELTTFLGQVRALTTQVHDPAGLEKLALYRDYARLLLDVYEGVREAHYTAPDGAKPSP